jgi:hypothetical protein
MSSSTIGFQVRGGGELFPDGGGAGVTATGGGNIVGGDGGGGGGLGVTGCATPAGVTTIGCVPSDGGLFSIKAAS